MASAEEIDVVRDWYNTHDPNLLATDCVWEIAQGFPHGGIYQGSQTIVENFFPKLQEDFDVWDAEVDRIMIADDILLGLGSYIGRTKSNGIEVKVLFAHLWKVQGGKIVWFRNYTDTLLLAHALQS
jgi:uncharacterized protein